jgi:hypothetical protein
MRRRRTPQGEPGMLSRQPPASRSTVPPFLYRGTRLFRRHTSHEFENSNTSPTQDLSLLPLTHSPIKEGVRWGLSRSAVKYSVCSGRCCHARTHARSSHSAPPHCTARSQQSQCGVIFCIFGRPKKHMSMSQPASTSTHAPPCIRSRCPAAGPRTRMGHLRRCSRREHRRRGRHVRRPGRRLRRTVMRWVLVLFVPRHCPAEPSSHSW